MANNISIDYTPNRCLYVVQRNKEGRVWHNKRHRWVEWKDEDISSYLTNFVYKGGDRYVAILPVIPKPLRPKQDEFQIFEITTKHDYLIGNTTKIKVKEYPNVKSLIDDWHFSPAPDPNPIRKY